MFIHWSNVVALSRALSIKILLNINSTRGRGCLFRSNLFFWTKINSSLFHSHIELSTPEFKRNEECNCSWSVFYLSDCSLVNFVVSYVILCRGISVQFTIYNFFTYFFQFICSLEIMNFQNSFKMLKKNPTFLHTYIKFVYFFLRSLLQRSLI